MLNFSVVGPGGVGGFIAAALARAGESVNVVARPETAALINERGIVVRSVRLGDFTQPVAAVDRLAAPVDVLIVATKAGGLLSALDRVDPAASPGIVLPLLNGLDHMTALRSRFGAQHVAAGSIRIEADRPEPGLVVHTSPFLRVDMAADDAGLAGRLPEVAAALERAEVPAQILGSEAEVLWGKLVRLVALATTTSAADRPIGFIRESAEWRPRLEGVIGEAAAAACAEGAMVDAGERLAELDAAHPGLGSSMQRDIAAGRAPELDAIAGAVLRAAARHGLSTPHLTELSALVAARAGISPPRV